MRTVRGLKRVLKRGSQWLGVRQQPIRNAVSEAQEGRIQESLAYYRSLKDKFRGRRGFVIGNGPSLRMADLDRLNDEVTVASNKVYLAFPHVNWRPTIFTVVDPLVWEKIRSEIPSEIAHVHLPHYFEPGTGLDRPIHVWRTLGYGGELRERDRRFNGVEFSTDVTEGLYGSCTVTFENLQMAVHLGLSPIYIIGCDHYYAGESNAQRGQRVVAGNFNNHFLPNYRQPGEQVNPAQITNMNRGYREARIFSDRLRIPILNATRGGHLEAFLRVDFDSVI